MCQIVAYITVPFSAALWMGSLLPISFISISACGQFAPAPGHRQLIPVTNSRGKSESNPRTTEDKNVYNTNMTCDPKNNLVTPAYLSGAWYSRTHFNKLLAYRF